MNPTKGRLYKGREGKQEGIGSSWGGERKSEKEKGREGVKIEGTKGRKLRESKKQIRGQRCVGLKPHG